MVSTLPNGEHLAAGPDPRQTAGSNVAAKARNESPGLEKGQLWRADESYLQIVEIGNRLVHYKLLQRPDQRAALTRLIGIDALAVYLRNTEASLVS